VYVTEQRECVTMYSKRRVYYKTIQGSMYKITKTERLRYNLQKKNGAYPSNKAMTISGALLQQAMWITKKENDD